ncbi:MAG TPA: DUF2627 domain-containing protein [Pseudogracilibacillus sp.]|nr:DUF2627 domain-containing protein [Pseudogracilibacillus sp.]
MSRIFAVIVMFTPGVIGAFGIKLMRDAVFAEVSPILFNEIIQFIIGFIMFAIGLAFIGGFIYHRDKKKQLIKERNKSK